jgi:perosamine synthetase
LTTSQEPPFLPLSVPVLEPSATQYVQDCLASGWVSSVGPIVEGFERDFSALHEAAACVAVASGTAALHLSLLVAGVERDDLVLMPALTFIAPANAVRYCGAWPIFVDADPLTWQMDVGQLVTFLLEQCDAGPDGVRHRGSGRRVGAILPVHLLGNPVDLEPLIAVAADLGLPVVEDATESLGSHYHGRPVGCFGAAGCFSFNGNKTITTGGGGMVVASSPEIARRIRHLSTQAKCDPTEYIHDAVGYNYRLTSLQAALGRSQLESLEVRLIEKRRITARYRELLEPQGFGFAEPTASASMSWWLTTVVLPAGLDPRQVSAAMSAARIETRRLWQPMHRSPAHERLTTSAELPVADMLYERALSLPSTHTVSDSDIERVCTELVAAVQRV